MPGLYGPYKVYTPGEVLTAADLNATDQNHITNQTPQMTDDYQIDLAQKREQIDPALGLATSMAGDLAQLRYTLAKVGRVQFWDQIVGPPTTGLFGYYSGFKCSNSASAPDTELMVGAGAGRSDDNTTDIILASSMTKALNAPWIAGGAGAGMLDGGAMVANTWYYIYAIERIDTEQSDVLASTSFTTPTMPVNYTKKKLIFAIQTDATNKIKGFVHIREWVVWKKPILDQNVTDLGTTRVLYLVSVPLGFESEVLLNAWVNSGQLLYFTGPGVADDVPSLTAAPLATLKASTNAQAITQVKAWTDVDGKVGVRSSAAGTDLRLSTVAYRNIV